MGFTEIQFVSRPPENRMKLSETMPMNCAAFGSSNRIPPMPSDPANIPIAKKSFKAGTPNLYEVLPAIMLTKSNRDPTNSRFSIVKFMLYYLINRVAQSYPCCLFAIMKFTLLFLYLNAGTAKVRMPK